MRIGVGALIFDKRGRILLSYRTDKCKFYKNCWFLPCGKAELGEKPSDAIIREVKEEISLETSIVKEVYRKNRKRIAQIAFVCKVIGGKMYNHEPEKMKDWRFFYLDDLPVNTGKRTLEIIKSYRDLLNL